MLERCDTLDAGNPCRVSSIRYLWLKSMGLAGLPYVSQYGGPPRLGPCGSLVALDH